MRRHLYKNLFYFAACLWMDGINDRNDRLIWGFVLSKSKGQRLLISDHVDCDKNSMTFQRNMLPSFQSKSARVERRSCKRPSPKLLHVSVRIHEPPSLATRQSILQPLHNTTRKLDQEQMGWTWSMNWGKWGSCFKNRDSTSALPFSL